MTTKSPTTSVRSREIIGEDQFSQRREVFDKHDTVFLPLPSPTSMVPVTSNHGKTTSNFKRNAPGYSSMREGRNEDRNIEFRSRKYSDNFTSEVNQSDDVDYRYSMTERTRRLSKLRRDFLNSNLHEPNNDSPFVRTGVRASMPASSTSVVRYKIESPNLYKFPFAEPYATPPPVRRVVVDLGPTEVNGEKENQDPEAQPKPKHQSLPNNDSSPKIDHQKLFDELVKRYSPQRKPVDWKLPPTRPRVVGSVPKSFSSVADSVDSTDKNILEETLNDDDVFVKKDIDSEKQASGNHNSGIEREPKTKVIKNGPEIIMQEKKEDAQSENTAKASEVELEENKDQVSALANVLKVGNDSSTRPSLGKKTDLTLPELVEKIAEDAELGSQKMNTKKLKRKRSFLDKLLGRNKQK